MKKFDVLAIGELNVDLILTGLKSMPALGREIIAKEMSLTLGGSTVNCACGISKQGLKTGFYGKIGQDKFGEVVLDFLNQYKIDTENISIHKDLSTGLSISLSLGKDRAFVTYLGAIDAITYDDIDLELVKSSRHIHVGSYFLQSKLRPGLPKLFAFARENGVTTSLDAGWDDTEQWDYGIFDALKYTDVFMPNEEEALHITKQESVIDAVKVLSRYAKIAAVKCGPRGAIAKWGDELKSQKPYDLNLLDTTGAGDAFNAGFLYGFLNAFNLEECMRYGNACGSICVTRVGGASSCPTLSEVEELIKK